MKNFLLVFLSLICFAQTSFAQNQCCTEIRLDAHIDDCDVSICVSPTEIWQFCDDFPYRFRVQVRNSDGEGVQDFEIEEFCYSNFQGIPGEDYTITFSSLYNKGCETPVSASTSFTFPEDCENCCVPYVVEAEVVDCTIEYCLVPEGPLCEEPVSSISRVRDQFGDLVEIIKTSTFCYTIPDVQGGFSYSIGGNLNYELACDISDDVISATVYIPLDCAECTNECIELLTWVISPGETCQSTQWISVFYDSCNENFIQNPEGYQFSWVGSNGVTSDAIFVVYNPGVTFTATLIDPDGCVFTGTVARYCTEPGMENENLIDSRKNTDFVLSPNPTMDVINISGLNQEKDLHIVIHNINGQMLGQWESDYNSELSINMQEAPVGQYVLTIMDQKRIVSNKMFVKN